MYIGEVSDTSNTILPRLAGDMETDSCKNCECLKKTDESLLDHQYLSSIIEAMKEHRDMLLCGAGKDLSLERHQLDYYIKNNAALATCLSEYEQAFKRSVEDKQDLLSKNYELAAELANIRFSQRSKKTETEEIENRISKIDM